ncbi:MAG: hypothetical protein CM1200mP41_20390 [Gammaproteobacteria bacterium]|nr:MAG: hypothetical protein CM1200mP41_20390 [Gammaproteobacteria bacterium]
MTETLPTPTTDVRRCVSDLESYGYCYLAAALSDTVLTRLQQRLSEQGSGGGTAGVGVQGWRTGTELGRFP